MVCYHPNYNLGDVQRMYFDEYLESEGLTESDIAVKLPLWLYDHSGISMSCGDRTYPYNDQWDSGLVGTIYVTKEKIKSEYGVKRISKKLLDEVTRILKNEIKTYDQYLPGDIYGFTLYKKDKCDLEHEHLEHIDSCWGFYGDDPNQNGMSDHIENFEKFVER